MEVAAQVGPQDLGRPAIFSGLIIFAGVILDAGFHASEGEVPLALGGTFGETTKARGGAAPDTLLDQHGLNLVVEPSFLFWGGGGGQLHLKDKFVGVVAVGVWGGLPLNAELVALSIEELPGLLGVERVGL